jgi:hypothetical protein
MKIAEKYKIRHDGSYSHGWFSSITWWWDIHLYWKTSKIQCDVQNPETNS